MSRIHFLMYIKDSRSKYWLSTVDTTNPGWNRDLDGICCVGLGVTPAQFLIIHNWFLVVIVS